MEIICGRGNYHTQFLFNLINKAIQRTGWWLVPMLWVNYGQRFDIELLQTSQCLNHFFSYWQLLKTSCICDYFSTFKGTLVEVSLFLKPKAVILRHTRRPFSQMPTACLPIGRGGMQKWTSLNRSCHMATLLHPTVDSQTDMTENITFQQTTYVGAKMAQHYDVFNRDTGNDYCCSFLS